MGRGGKVRGKNIKEREKQKKGKLLEWGGPCDGNEVCYVDGRGRGFTLWGSLGLTGGGRS